MSQTTLDATRECDLRAGVRKTTMAEIASQAGISRAMLYRRFPTHDDVFLSVLEIESEELASDAATHLASPSHPTDRVVEGILFHLDQVANRPLHAHCFSGETALWSAGHVLRSDALQRISRNLLGLSLGQRETDSSPNPELEDLTEWILRILISFITLPSPDLANDSDTARRFVRAVLGPSIAAAIDRTGTVSARGLLTRSPVAALAACSARSRICTVSPMGTLPLLLFAVIAFFAIRACLRTEPDPTYDSASHLEPDDADKARTDTAERRAEKKVPILQAALEIAKSTPASCQYVPDIPTDTPLDVLQRAFRMVSRDRFHGEAARVGGSRHERLGPRWTLRP
jgi:AcrR family transcriptional regulator